MLTTFLWGAGLDDLHDVGRAGLRFDIFDWEIPFLSDVIVDLDRPVRVSFDVLTLEEYICKEP